MAISNHAECAHFVGSSRRATKHFVWNAASRSNQLKGRLCDEGGDEKYRLISARLHFFLSGSALAANIAADIFCQLAGIRNIRYSN